MKKKFVCVLMALAMVFALAACGQNNDTPSNNNSDTPSSNDTPSTDNNSGSETLKIGAVGPLTGGYANYGLSVQNGAKLAVEEINKNGGVGGKQLTLEMA